MAYRAFDGLRTKALFLQKTLKGRFPGRYSRYQQLF